MKGSSPSALRKVAILLLEKDQHCFTELDPVAVLQCLDFAPLQPLPVEHYAIGTACILNPIGAIFQPDEPCVQTAHTRISEQEIIPRDASDPYYWLVEFIDLPLLLARFYQE